MGLFMIFISVLQLPELSLLIFHICLIFMPISCTYSELCVRPFKATYNTMYKSVRNGPIVMWASFILLGNIL
jgi:hypothetical protein